MVGGPQIERVALGLAFGMEAAEHAFAQVDRERPVPLGGRVVQRARSATLRPGASQGIEVAQVLEDFLDRHLAAKCGDVEPSMFAMLGVRAPGGLAWLVAVALAPRGETELEACRRLAPKYAAKVEVVMPDETRCDLLSEEYAIEVDWAHKHHEAVSQAVLYAIWTGREPAVLLLVTDRSPQSKLYLLRAKLVCERLGIRLFIEPSEVPPRGVEPLSSD